MRKKITIVLVSVVAVFATFIVGFMVRAVTDNRSVPGRIVRFIRGESGMDQDLNDLAEDIRKMPSLSKLQPWGVEILKKYREGKLQTNGYAHYYWGMPPAVKLATSEKPEFIKRQWGETNEFGEEEPEVFILFDDSNKPEAVAIGWYMYGVEIGPPEYRITYASNYYCPYMEVKPGIYVYGNYK